jgi:hypothetical protein
MIPMLPRASLLPEALLLLLLPLLLLLTMMEINLLRVFVQHLLVPPNGLQNIHNSFYM